jgi:hypothetical protein
MPKDRTEGPCHKFQYPGKVQDGRLKIMDAWNLCLEPSLNLVSCILNPGSFSPFITYAFSIPFTLYFCQNFFG